jgi:acyl-CoA reductase-like NAD-dependent aldehyde dehydrogenase
VYDLAHFVDGAPLAVEPLRWGSIYDPNAGEVQGRVALADAAVVDRAVMATAAARWPESRLEGGQLEGESSFIIPTMR